MKLNVVCNLMYLVFPSQKDSHQSERIKDYIKGKGLTEAHKQ